MDARQSSGWTALHEAVHNNQTGATASLLGARAGANAMTGDGFSPLHLAVLGESYGVLAALLKAGANPKTVDPHGLTPLHVAAEENAVPAARAILEFAASSSSAQQGVGLIGVLEARDDLGATPLHLAALSGGPEVADNLIRAGADLDATTLAGNTPLHLAAGRGNSRPFHVLLDAGASLQAADANGWTALFHACVSDDPALVGTTLARGADLRAVDQFGRSAAHVAAEAGCLQTLRFVVEAGVDVAATDAQGWTAAYDGCKSGDPAVLAFLVETCGVVLDTSDSAGVSPLHVAVTAGNAPVVAYVLDVLGLERSAVAVNALTDGGYAALHLAARQGQADACGLLLAAGADVGLCDDAGETALHHAVRAGSLACVDVLVAVGGANLGAAANDGATPLHMAAVLASDELVAALLSAGADPNTHDALGLVPLHHAVIERDEESAVVLLCDPRIGVDAVDDDNRSALHLAADAGDNRLVSLLLDGGAAREIQDSVGCTALHHAGSCVCVCVWCVLFVFSVCCYQKLEVLFAFSLLANF